MVFCASHFLPLVLLLPFPTAAPLLVVLYLFSLWLTVRPCVYCSVMISFVLVSTSYHPLFPPPSISSALAPAPLPPTLALPNFTLPLSYLTQPTSADPERGWLDLNAGRLLDPVWVAFKHRDDVIALEVAKLEALRRAEEAARTRAQAEAELAQEAADERLGFAQRTLRRLTALFARSASPPQDPPPPPPPSVHARGPNSPRWDGRRKRLDLRWNGVGAVLDFGFGRGEDEVRAGVEDEARRRVDERLAADAAVRGKS